MSLQAVADGYTKMVSLVSQRYKPEDNADKTTPRLQIAAILDKLFTVPKNEILAFWRATSPGDPECEQYPARKSSAI